MRSVALLSALWLMSLSPLPGWAAPIPCACDVTKPATLKARSCSLCAVTEKQPASVVAFSIKDSSKLKPNRWLALPRTHTPGHMEMLSDLPADTRAALWREAIGRGQLLWGEHWGLAVNSVDLRSQCHLHIHIGKLIDGVEYGDFTVVDDVTQIPDPGASGMWIHPVAGKFHVHMDKAPETVLLR